MTILSPALPLSPDGVAATVNRENLPGSDRRSHFDQVGGRAGGAEVIAPFFSPDNPRYAALHPSWRPIIAAANAELYARSHPITSPDDFRLAAVHASWRPIIAAANAELHGGKPLPMLQARPKGNVASSAPVASGQLERNLDEWHALRAKNELEEPACECPIRRGTDADHAETAEQKPRWSPPGSEVGAAENPDDVRKAKQRKKGLDAVKKAVTG